ncbi:MAG: hypothetical protein V3R93_07200 [Candidatus Hydrothermarchaeaceae archaeon]
MRVKNVQTVLKIREYDMFKEALKHEKMPLKEGVREAILTWTRQRAGFNRKDSFFATKNLFAGKKDLAEKHDEIYED